MRLSAQTHLRARCVWRGHSSTALRKLTGGSIACAVRGETIFVLNRRPATCSPAACARCKYVSSKEGVKNLRRGLRQNILVDCDWEFTSESWLVFLEVKAVAHRCVQHHNFVEHGSSCARQCICLAAWVFGVAFRTGKSGSDGAVDDRVVICDQMHACRQVFAHQTSCGDGEGKICPEYRDTSSP